MTFEPLIADHILVFLFGIVFPANAIFRSQPLMKTLGDWSTDMKIAFYRGNGAMLWLMAAVVVGLWLFAGRSLGDLGFRLPLPGTWMQSLLLSGAFLLAYGIDAWQEVATPGKREKTVSGWRKNTPFLPENKRELRAFFGLSFSAAVGEEVLFRGYFISYLLALFGLSYGAKVAALLIPTAIFAVSHYYQGWNAIGKIALLSLAFGLLFLISGSLLLPVVLHLVVDVVGGWLAFRVMSESAQQKQ